jgi:hypothetical protein
MAKYGFSALNQNLNANANNGFAVKQAISQANLIKAVRVLSIVLDETHPRFKELGEWNGLGIIEYEDVNNPLPSPSLPTARPLAGNFKNLPLINEIVYLVGFPNTDIDTISSNTVEYYLNIVSLWNHPHHNAYPTAPNALPPTQQKDYIQTTGGNVRRVTDQSTEIFLGKTFKERSNIHPLLPFEGDILEEGRWGNSIRIGSTVQNTPNNWSSVGTNGDPILIIRNGQGTQTEQGWIPTVEDINNDESSIYATSTQKIPLKASSVNYLSYPSNPPQSPDQYSGKQILINSGRLVFNTTLDHILLSSKKSINLNALDSINIDCNTVIVQSGKLYLGSKNATEPLLLGNSTISTLNNLIDNLGAFLQVCSTVVATAPGTPLVPLNLAANQLSIQLKVIQKNYVSLGETNACIYKLIN